MNKEEIKNIEKHRQELIKENNTLKNLLEIERNQVKRLAEKINFVRCSTQLKGKEVPTFEDWLKDKYINLGRGTYQHRLYHFKKDKEQCLKIYNALEKPLIV